MSTVGLNEIANTNGISIYPNPAKGEFTISIKAEVKNAQLEIYNVMLEKIYSITLINKQETINTKQFSSGTYFIKVTDGEKLFTQKFVVE